MRLPSTGPALTTIQKIASSRIASARSARLLDISFLAEEQAAGTRPAAFHAYFCVTTAVLCDPNCAVTEVLATLALAVCVVVALLP
jgi:hypothetical protein